MTRWFSRSYFSVFSRQECAYFPFFTMQGHIYLWTPKLLGLVIAPGSTHFLSDNMSHKPNLLSLTSSTEIHTDNYRLGPDQTTTWEETWLSSSCPSAWMTQELLLLLAVWAAVWWARHSTKTHIYCS